MSAERRLRTRRGGIAAAPPDAVGPAPAPGGGPRCAASACTPPTATSSTWTGSTARPSGARRRHPPRARGLVRAPTTWRGSAARRAALGWRAVVMNFRSCSGELNRPPRLYHSGETSDLDWVLGELAEREPGRRASASSACPSAATSRSSGSASAGSARPRRDAGGGGHLDAVRPGRAARARSTRGFGRALYTESFLRTMKAKIRAKAAPLRRSRRPRRRRSGRARSRSTTASSPRRSSASPTSATTGRARAARPTSPTSGAPRS